MSWAQLPVAWLAAGQDSEDPPFLAQLQWREHKGAGVGAILVLFALVLKRNSLQPRAKGEPRVEKFALSYEELINMTDLARATIVKAIGLLELWGVLVVERVGRANQYELVGLGQGSSWRKLPVKPLLEGERLRIRSLPRSKHGLNVLKIYIALLYSYSDQYGTAAFGYTGLVRFTGVRREEIRSAMDSLYEHRLIGVSGDRDLRHQSDNDQSNRYVISGLGNHRQNFPAAPLAGIPGAVTQDSWPAIKTASGTEFRR